MAAVKFNVMNDGAEPMQQPIRQTVGRPPTVSRRLEALEDLTCFLNKYVHGSFTRIEGDYFPVRKVVGRPA